MPNWCSNKLTVQCKDDKTEFYRFIDKGRKKELVNCDEQLIWRISNYIPTPEEMLIEGLNHKEKVELLDKYGFDDGEDWKLFHWGTRSDCNDFEFGSELIDGEFFTVAFYSAWSPPKEWLINVSSMFPTLSFRLEFIETGIQFSGITIIDNGVYLDLCGRPAFKDEKGNIVEVEYDDENELYTLSNGRIYEEHEWFDEDISIECNPFENFNYPFNQ
jgi:hypothetical protein